MEEVSKLRCNPRTGRISQAKGPGLAKNESNTEVKEVLVSLEMVVDRKDEASVAKDEVGEVRSH